MRQQSKKIPYPNLKREESYKNLHLMRKKRLKSRRRPSLR
jgi:hypothetical protein